MRGGPRPQEAGAGRGEVAPERRPAPVPLAPDRVAELPREVAAPRAPEPQAPDRAAPGAALPVVLGDAQGFGVRVEALVTDEGWRATVHLQNRTTHAWAAVEVALAPLVNRRPAEATIARIEGLGRGARASASVDAALPAGADRVRVSVLAAEPQPGEAAVAWRAGRLRGFDVRGARLLRTRAHELDAILDLGGGPREHVAWSGADLRVVFLDDRGEEITAGRARLTRGQGPPWRLHVVGAETSRRQVALIDLRCEDLRFD